MLANPRNRVVVFRLSGHEYLTLKDACCARGARNISDFTRSELLSHLHFDRFAAIEQRLAELQSVVARNVSAWDNVVLSVTRVLAGNAYNVIPETATLGGTVRAMRRETLTKVEGAMRRVATGTAAAFGATASLARPSTGSVRTSVKTKTQRKPDSEAR